MKKKFLVIPVMILLSLAFLAAHSSEDFSQAEQIIQQKISCNQLNETQLALLGDYYMEKIHPSEQHEYMDAMMGGEGSASLEAMHINMGIAFYCNGESLNENTLDTISKYTLASSGGGMIGNGYGMMSGAYYQNPMNYWTWFVPIALAIIIALLIVLIVLQSVRRKR